MHGGYQGDEKALSSSTLSRLDLVFVFNNSICLFKLTIPTNTQQHLAARAQKEDQYGSLQHDLQLSELNVGLISIKIGCLDARHNCSSG